jgi:hypothetical protein
LQNSLRINVILSCAAWTERGNAGRAVSDNGPFH